LPERLFESPAANSHRSTHQSVGVSQMSKRRSVTHRRTGLRRRITGAIGIAVLAGLLVACSRGSTRSLKSSGSPAVSSRSDEANRPRTVPGMSSGLSVPQRPKTDAYFGAGASLQVQLTEAGLWLVGTAPSAVGSDSLDGTGRATFTPFAEKPAPQDRSLPALRSLHTFIAGENLLYAGSECERCSSEAVVELVSPEGRILAKTSLEVDPNPETFPGVISVSQFGSRTLALFSGHQTLLFDVSRQPATVDRGVLALAGGRLCGPSSGELFAVTVSNHEAVATPVNSSGEPTGKAVGSGPVATWPDRDGVQATCLATGPAMFDDHFVYAFTPATRTWTKLGPDRQGNRLMLRTADGPHLIASLGDALYQIDIPGRNLVKVLDDVPSVTDMTPMFGTTIRVNGSWLAMIPATNRKGESVVFRKLPR
jgi:hypothetical protein